MAFKLNHDGTITTDTAAELLEIVELRKQRQEREQQAQQRLTEEIARRVVAKPEEPRSVSELLNRETVDREAAYRALYDAMADQDKQQVLLRTLVYKAPQALSDDELRVKLALKSNLDLRGLMIGIIRRAKNRGLDNPIRKEMTRSDGGRKRHYRYAVSGAFRDAMADYKFRGALLESVS